jgi:hypothetical protein
MGSFRACVNYSLALLLSPTALAHSRAISAWPAGARTRSITRAARWRAASTVPLAIRVHGVKLRVTTAYTVHWVAVLWRRPLWRGDLLHTPIQILPEWPARMLRAINALLPPVSVPTWVHRSTL